MIINVLLSIIVISFLILVHELGHFIFARLFGVKIFEFSIGFGNKLYQIKKNNTLYTLRLLPFGGYVRLAGVDKTVSDDKYLDSESFKSLNYIKKTIILAAGSFSNLFLGFLLLFCISFFVGIPEGVSQNIDQVYPGTPAEKVGLQSGDHILEINNKVIADGLSLIETIAYSNGDGLDLIIERDAKKIKLYAIAEKNEKSNKYYLGFKLKAEEIIRFSVFKSIKRSCIELFSYVVLILSAFAGLLLGKVSFVQISGPIGIVSMTGEMVNYGLLYLMRFIVILNINLAILNMFPIPALDGGRIMILTVEKLIRKTLNEETVDRIHYFGGLVLITLLVYITYMDIKKIIIK